MERQLFVKISKPSYEYDVNSIVRAFYPDRLVKVLTDESRSLWEEYRRLNVSAGLPTEISEENASERMKAEEADFEEIEIELLDTGASMKMLAEGKQPELYGAVYEWQWEPGAASDSGDYKAGFKTFLYKRVRLF